MTVGFCIAAAAAAAIIYNTALLPLYLFLTKNFENILEISETRFSRNMTGMTNKNICGDSDNM
jgi:hypothetical protein